jgi:hypothetical protein
MLTSINGRARRAALQAYTTIADIGKEQQYVNDSNCIHSIDSALQHENAVSQGPQQSRLINFPDTFSLSDSNPDASNQPMPVLMDTGFPRPVIFTYRSTRCGSSWQ